MTADDTAARDADGDGIRVLDGDPTPAELAALTAVLSAALEDLASQERRVRTGQSAWQRSQRAIRRPLVPGTWGSFGRR